MLKMLAFQEPIREGATGAKHPLEVERAVKEGGTENKNSRVQWKKWKQSNVFKLEKEKTTFKSWLTSFMALFQANAVSWH